MCFALDTGARPKECFELKVVDFNFRAMEVRVLADVAKTGSARTLPMSAITAQAVKSLIGCRHEQWGEEVPVFCSAAGTPFRNDTGLTPRIWTTTPG